MFQVISIIRRNRKAPESGHSREPSFRLRPSEIASQPFDELDLSGVVASWTGEEVRFSDHLQATAVTILVWVECPGFEQLVHILSPPSFVDFLIPKRHQEAGIP